MLLRRFFAVILCCQFAVNIFFAAPRHLIAQDVTFDNQVLPILQAKCFRCHNQQRVEGGLQLDLKETALKGGDSGLAIVPGQPAHSLLLQRIKSNDEFERMPQEAARLSNDEISVLTQWVEQGANGLRDVKQTEHWAFKPIRNPELLPVNDRTWPLNSVDHFVLALLEQANLNPAPRAPNHQLIRRLFFDLLGVPPTVVEVAEFESDTSPDAYEQLVERLLADPKFGERWGRHWLDLARYADSGGYEADLPRKIWHYRDWVIEAMNHDKPITKFVIEQIGGDLLPDATVENRVASGFHCNAMLDGGVREQAVLDRVNSTGAVFLGLTLECAQCHDHKTDPISQKEYYQLYSFFHGASAVPLDLSPQELKDRIAEIDQQIASLNEQIAKVDQTIQDSLDELVQSEIKKREVVDRAILALLEIPAEDRSEADISQLVSFFQSADQQRNMLKLRLEEIEKQRPEPETTLVLSQDNRKTHIFVRGDPRQLGEEVTAGTPAFLHSIQNNSLSEQNQNRETLGEWIVARENPLFARVMANRIWLRLMGKAIAIVFGCV